MVKIQRSYPAPGSLEVERRKADGSYSESDVIERLQRDFHNKCYICELRELQDPQVEHLLPHKKGKYKARKFDWENLFWACGHCNGVKNQEQYDKGILDCCKRDPESAMVFQLQENDIHVSAVNSEDAEAVLAAQLVTAVFNIRNTGLRVYKSDLRMKKLQEEMNILYRNLDALKEKPASKLLLATIKALLRRESAFAGFKRSYVKEHLAQFPQLEEYIM